MMRLMISIVIAGFHCMMLTLPVMAAGRQVKVEMRDGVTLSTTVWVPGNGKYPVVLTRGYSASGLGGSAPKWNQKGYAFVSQQTRGNGGDDGSRFFPDDKDGYDCVQWIADQPWCNGKVAMWGGLGALVAPVVFGLLGMFPADTTFAEIIGAMGVTAGLGGTFAPATVAAARRGELSGGSDRDLLES